jgi:hypothetical protein
MLDPHVGGYIHVDLSSGMQEIKAIGACTAKVVWLAAKRLDVWIAKTANTNTSSIISKLVHGDNQGIGGKLFVVGWRCLSKHVVQLVRVYLEDGAMIVVVKVFFLPQFCCILVIDYLCFMLH